MDRGNAKCFILTHNHSSVQNFHDTSRTCFSFTNVQGNVTIIKAFRNKQSSGQIGIGCCLGEINHSARASYQPAPAWMISRTNNYRLNAKASLSKQRHYTQCFRPQKLHLVIKTLIHGPNCMLTRC